MPRSFPGARGSATSSPTCSLKSPRRDPSPVARVAGPVLGPAPSARPAKCLYCCGRDGRIALLRSTDAPDDPALGFPVYIPTAARDWPMLNSIIYYSCIRLAFWISTLRTTSARAHCETASRTSRGRRSSPSRALRCLTSTPSWAPDSPSAPAPFEACAHMPPPTLSSLRLIDHWRPAFASSCPRSRTAFRATAASRWVSNAGWRDWSAPQTCARRPVPARPQPADDVNLTHASETSRSSEPVTAGGFSATRSDWLWPPSARGWWCRAALRRDTAPARAPAFRRQLAAHPHRCRTLDDGCWRSTRGPGWRYRH